MTNSRDKGSRGEREAASVLRRELGVQVERSVQRSGKGLYGPADLLVFDEAGDLSRLAVEVKRVESISVAKLVEFVRQAREDAEDAPSVVMHRKNSDPWLVSMHVCDFVRVARAVVKLWEVNDGRL